MTTTSGESVRRIAFVARRLSGESVRSARAVAALDGASLLGICQELPEAGSAQMFADVATAADVHSAGDLIDAARCLAARNGDLNRIVTTTETLLEPVARAGEALGLEGMTVETVRRVLHKANLKQAMGHAGIITARDRVLTNKTEAISFAKEVGFPIVMKPSGGSGGLATWRINDSQQLNLAIELMQPSPSNAVIAEEYLRGRELCIDTITIHGVPQLYSICCYRPSILKALEAPQIQWSCVMPREMDGAYDEFIERGLAAVRALSVGNAMTHMEGFLLEGGGVRFTDATLRPAGARIGPMLGLAYDEDVYLAWARVAVDGVFRGPWLRKYAVGTIFLRGIGSGTVARIEGIETVKSRLGEMLVDGRLPCIGAPTSATYTGDGYMTIRHPETRAVEDALDLVARTVRITYSQPAEQLSVAELWKQRLGYFDKQLYRPAWDNDSVPPVMATTEA